MTWTFREPLEADYPVIAGILNAAGTRYAVSAAELLHLIRGVREHPSQPHYFELVAEYDGTLVADLTIWQNGGRFDSDRYEVALAVHPEVQGRGLGRTLAQKALEHLQVRKAREIISGTYETQVRGLDFLARQGFTEQFRYFDNVLDLREWNAARCPVPGLPQGLRLLTLPELMTELGEESAWRAYHAAFSEARTDIPSELPPSATLYDVFRKRDEHPGFLPDGVLLAVTTDGEVSALSELRTDPQNADIMHIGLTGTRRKWRRKGLARTLKLAGLHLALKRGATWVKTANATSNAPIVELNNALGFKPERVFIEFRRSML